MSEWQQETNPEFKSCCSRVLQQRLFAKSGISRDMTYLPSKRGIGLHTGHRVISDIFKRPNAARKPRNRVRRELAGRTRNI